MTHTQPADLDEAPHDPMTQLVVGIDPHKRNLTYVATQGREELDHEVQIPARTATLEDLAETYPHAVFLLEAVGPHEWMHDVLTEQDCTVIVAQAPRRDPTENKHDLADARRLVQRYQLGDLDTVTMATPEQRTRRDVVRKRQLLVDKRQDLRNSIEDTLNRVGYFAQPRPNPFTDDGRQEALEQVEHLTALYQALDGLDDQIEALTDVVEAQADEDPSQAYLESIPGVGTITGQALSAEVLDPERFARSEQVVSYFGLDPEVEESGGNRKDLHQITKQGKGYVRGLLVQAAWSHVRSCPTSSITQAFQAKAEAKGEQIAIVMTARKLLKVAWTVMLEQRAFSVAGPPPGSRAAVVGPVAKA